MRHRKHRHQLGVKKEHRAALMANLAAALFKHGRIETTLAKAKALRPFAEKIITMAKKARQAPPPKALHLRRLAIARVRDKEAVRTLFDTRAAEFEARPGGYTRIYKLGARAGDAAERALIVLIPAADEGYGKRRKKKTPAAAAPRQDAPLPAEPEETGPSAGPVKADPAAPSQETKE